MTALINPSRNRLGSRSVIGLYRCSRSRSLTHHPTGGRPSRHSVSRRDDRRNSEPRAGRKISPSFPCNRSRDRCLATWPPAGRERRIRCAVSHSSRRESCRCGDRAVLLLHAARGPTDLRVDDHPFSSASEANFSKMVRNTPGLFRRTPIVQRGVRAVDFPRRVLPLEPLPMTSRMAEITVLSSDLGAFPVSFGSGVDVSVLRSAETIMICSFFM